MRLAVFIKSEMQREVRENCFRKHQRYPIITIECQNKTTMTDKRHKQRYYYKLQHNKHFGNTTRT